LFCVVLVNSVVLLLGVCVVLFVGSFSVFLWVFSGFFGFLVVNLAYFVGTLGEFWGFLEIMRCLGLV